MAEITDACDLFTDDTSLDAQLASLLPSDATGALAQNVQFGSACRARAVLASPPVDAKCRGRRVAAEDDLRGRQAGRLAESARGLHHERHRGLKGAGGDQGGLRVGRRRPQRTVDKQQLPIGADVADRGTDGAGACTRLSLS